MYKFLEKNSVHIYSFVILQNPIAAPSRSHYKNGIDYSIPGDAWTVSRQTLPLWFRRTKKKLLFAHIFYVKPKIHVKFSSCLEGGWGLV